MAPKFGVGDGPSSSFDATLVLATMLVSQLQEGVPPEPSNSAGGHAAEQVGSEPQERSRQNASDHTRVWSELSGSNLSNGCDLFSLFCMITKTLVTSILDSRNWH